MGARTATVSPALALLDHAVSYTRQSLDAVTDDQLGWPTPCSRWDLRALLAHMDDSLAALTEAAELGRVDLAPRASDTTPTQIAQRLRTRACALLDEWHDHRPERQADEIVIGAASLDPGIVAALGALEITVHGWDVARAVHLEHPIPEPLAAALLIVAGDVVGEPDRPARFAAAVPSDSDDPAERLLAFLGR